MKEIPVAAPALDGKEQEYVAEAIRSSWISSSGPFIDRFEREFASLCGTRSAIAVANGTVALHAAALALGLRPGDEVIVPSLTYIATANIVRYAGAQPVFVDVDPKTWCIDPRQLEQRVSSRTKGIIAVHLYGHPADMDPINEIATRYHIWVLEDAAEAHFARYKGRLVGSLSAAATFSFYGNKILTCGEGGAITVNDLALEQRIRMLRGQGMDPERRYFFPIIGYNYRLTNIACAILCAQLERRVQIVSSRKAIFSLYDEQLSDVPGIGHQPVADWAEPAPWLYCITVSHNRYGRTRDELAAILKEGGIDSRPFFVPLHRLPPYENISQHHYDLPETDKLAATGLNLPTYPGLARKDIDRICELIRKSAVPS
jgi:perosamine synthetase